MAVKMWRVVREPKQAKRSAYVIQETFVMAETKKGALGAGLLLLGDDERKIFKSAYADVVEIGCVYRM